MRAFDRKDGFSVRAISGTRTVMLAMNARQELLNGFLGFGVGRRSAASGEITWLNGYKAFKSLVPAPVRGQRFSTSEHPIQDFKWGHYSAEPATDYTYIVRPLFRTENGNLAELRVGTDLSVKIQTEPEDSGKHTILFNRGAIVSQAYSERFDDSALSEAELEAELDNPQAERTAWLSHGLIEGALNFIKQAKNSTFSLHCAFYEFSYLPVIQELADAAGRGATVEVSYEAGHFMVESGQRVETTYGKSNNAALAPFAGRPKLHFRERIHHINIPHNKFMILKENGRPVQVWTGSTNISRSGFAGQSNNGHIVRDEITAQQYFDYWEVIARDERRAALKSFVDEHPRALSGDLPPNSITPFFSPRSSDKMLEWYGSQLDKVKQTMLLTSAFGVTPRLAKFFDNDRSYLRFLLMEQPSKGEGVQEKLERDRDTIIVLGQGLGVKGSQGNWKDIPGWKLEKWLWREHHFRTSGHVFFVHTKYMVLDPLTDDPQVFTGSANFSPPSLNANDENMLLIRGDQRVTDIYTTEYFRLLNHFYFRQVANKTAENGTSDPEIQFLHETDAWVAGHFAPDNYRSKRRELFGISP